VNWSWNGSDGEVILPGDVEGGGVMADIPAARMRMWMWIYMIIGMV